MDSTATDTSSLTPKYCAHPNCGKLLTQHKNEALSKFKRRAHCDEVCSKSNPNLRKRQSEEYAKAREEEGRECEICGGTFYRTVHQSRNTFNDKLTCSNKCAYKLRMRNKRAEAEAQPKICANPNCGKPFTRHVGQESESNFKARQTCSRKCGGALRTSRKQPRTANPKPKPKDTTSVPKLAPIKPAREIPPAPPSEGEVIVVWRPESWGGPYKRRVS